MKKLNTLVKVALTPELMDRAGNLASRDLKTSSKLYREITKGNGGKLPDGVTGDILEKFMDKRFRQRSKFQSGARKARGLQF